MTNPTLFRLLPSVTLFASSCYLLAWVSGWSLTSKAYPAPTLRGLKKRFFRCGGVGSVCFNGVLVTGASRFGLYLGVLFFRPGHSSIYVPWSELELGYQCKYWTRLKSVDGATISLTNREFSGLMEEAGRLGGRVEHLVSSADPAGSVRVFS